MFERWTVDSVAGEIERQAQGVPPTPRTVRRFYKHGRRQGRRKIDATAFRDFVVNCIDHAVSAVNLSLEHEKQQLTARVAQLEKVVSAAKTSARASGPTAQPAG